VLSSQIFSEKSASIRQIRVICVLFVRVYASWERGLNEYTNVLIRQYVPKKEEFKNFSDEDINTFQKKF